MRAEELSSADFAGKVAAEEVRVARVSLGLDGERARQQHVDVLSPIAGRVLRIQQQNAGVVAAGAPLIEVGDPAALEVVVDLLTTDAVQVQPGAPVSIEGWGGDHELSARVRRVEPSGFTRPSALGVDEQRVNVVLLLTEPHERWTALGDGYRVQARLVLWRAERVIKIPQGALFRGGGGWMVFRNSGGVAKMTRVVIGHRGDTEVEVLSGLSENDEVLVHPGDRVKDGVRVDVR
jgi:HlyD family secretion protein